MNLRMRMKGSSTVGVLLTSLTFIAKRCSIMHLRWRLFLKSYSFSINFPKQLNGHVKYFEFEDSYFASSRSFGLWLYTLRVLEDLLETQVRNIRSLWIKCLQALKVKVISAWLCGQCCLLPLCPRVYHREFIPLSHTHNTLYLPLNGLLFNVANFAAPSIGNPQPYPSLSLVVGIWMMLSKW